MKKRQNHDSDPLPPAKQALWNRLLRPVPNQPHFIALLAELKRQGFGAAADAIMASRNSLAEVEQQYASFVELDEDGQEREQQWSEADVAMADELEPELRAVQRETLSDEQAWVVDELTRWVEAVRAFQRKTPPGGGGSS